MTPAQAEREIDIPTANDITVTFISRPFTQTHQDHSDGSSAFMIPSTSIFSHIEAELRVLFGTEIRPSFVQKVESPIAAGKTMTPINYRLLFRCSSYDKSGLGPQRHLAIAAITQMIPPIAIAPTIPFVPVVPVAFKASGATAY